MPYDYKYVKDSETGECYCPPAWAYRKGRMVYTRMRNRYRQYYPYTYDAYREMYEADYDIIDVLDATMYYRVNAAGIDVYEEV